MWPDVDPGLQGRGEGGRVSDGGDGEAVVVAMRKYSCGESGGY